MREIKKCEKMIDGISIETWATEIYSSNILAVEVGTNGYMGGDSGHGSRTYLKIVADGGTDMRVSSHENIVEIEFGGDSELDTFIDALEFALEVLKDQKNNLKNEM